MSFSGPQAGRIAQFLQEGKLELGAIHTYLELYGRYFLDLTPRVALVAATMADREGNLFTGFSTEDTPAIVEATKFRQGIVIAQVNQIVDKLPRVASVLLCLFSQCNSQIYNVIWFINSD